MIRKWMDRAGLDRSKACLNKNTYRWLVLSNNLTETIKSTGAELTSEE